MRIILLMLALVAPAQNSTEHAAIEAVKAHLKDPDSAKFKGLKIEADGHGCGWVNAKNGYGGYMGFQVFFIGKDGKVALIPPDMSEPALC